MACRFPHRPLSLPQILGLVTANGLVSLTTSMPPALAQTQYVPTPPSLTSTVTDAVNQYLLGPGDSIRVSVLGFDEYNNIPPQVILPDGTISLPLVERFVAAGKTVNQVKLELTQRLSKYLVDPNVEVQIASLRPLTITISGEVRRPGPLQLQSLPTSSAVASGTEEARVRVLPTLSQAIAAAGGVTKEANLRDVSITRVNVSGVAQTTTLNLWQALNTNTAAQDIILRDGDSIFIPKATALNLDEQRLMARSAYGSRTVKVRVVGEVKDPGEIELPPDSTIASAIAIAGGPTDKANLGGVQFIRQLPNGTAQRRTLNVSNLTEPTQIDEGDVVIVPKAGVNAFLDGIGTVLGPLGAAAAFIRIFQ